MGRRRALLPWASRQYVFNRDIAKDDGRIDLRVAELVAPRTFQHHWAIQHCRQYRLGIGGLCLHGPAVRQGNAEWRQCSWHR